MLNSRNFVPALNAARVLSLVQVLFLSAACSDQGPDGHVFQMNGAGITLPIAGAEVAFVPGTSRAEFFQDPLNEAYVYATAGLGSELLPVCDQARTVLTELQDRSKTALESMRKNENLSADPDACLNMCKKRVDLESQRDQERKNLAASVANLNTEIESVQNAIRSLQASRSEKAGELGQLLSRLENEREAAISQHAARLLDEQVAKLTFSISPSTDYLYAQEEVRVFMKNGSDYAIVAAEYSNGPVLAGYYRGHKINEVEVRMPNYDNSSRAVKRDQFGFQKGYMLAPGETVEIGVSINAFPGVSVSSPEGRLLAAEKGWSANSKGYILPDAIRVKAFSPSLFVKPDERGRREGASIIYTPKAVDFRDEAARRGLPQDLEIARLKEKMDNQHYPEDDQIREKTAVLSGLAKQKKDLTDGFENSPLASRIKDLTTGEENCRVARDGLRSLEAESGRLKMIETNLSSCGSEELDPAAVFSGVAELNRSYDASIETPDITGRYESKAIALITAKLANSIEETSLTDADGGYQVADGVDPGSVLALVSWRSGVGEVFWFQPLAPLGDRKDLSYATAEDGSFDDYLEKVVSSGQGAGSLEELSREFALRGLEARSPYHLRAGFEHAAKVAAERVAGLEKAGSGTDADEAGPAPETPLVCEP